MPSFKHIRDFSVKFTVGFVLRYHLNHNDVCALQESLGLFFSEQKSLALYKGSDLQNNASGVMVTNKKNGF